MNNKKMEEIKYIEGMIIDLNKAINNASQFGDTVTINAINNQINKYKEVLEKLKKELQKKINKIYIGPGKPALYF